MPCLFVSFYSHWSRSGQRLELWFECWCCVFSCFSSSQWKIRGKRETWWGFLRDVWTGWFFHDRLTVLQLRSFRWKVSIFPHLDAGLTGDSRATPIIMYVHVPQLTWHEHNSCSRVDQASLNTAEAQESLPLGLDIHYTCSQLLETVLMEYSHV